MSESEKFTVLCPDCQAEITIDKASGTILHHRAAKAPPAEGKDFDSLFADLEHSKQRADTLFQQEVSALKDSGRILEEKFQEALRRAEEEPDDKPPVRPWDLD